jgi:hypothetical protein
MLQWTMIDPLNGANDLGFVMLDNGPDYPYGAYVFNPGFGGAITDEQLKAFEETMRDCWMTSESRNPHIRREIVTNLTDHLRAFPDPEDRKQIRQYLVTRAVDAACLSIITEAFDGLEAVPHSPMRTVLIAGGVFTVLALAVGGVVLARRR